MWKALEPVPNPNLDELLPEAKKYLEMIIIIIDELCKKTICHFGFSSRQS